MTYGFTDREAPILARKSYQETGYVIPWYVWTAFIAVLIATGVSVSFMLASNAPISERAQESVYCNYATHGVPVRGATASDLETHCLTHG